LLIFIEVDQSDAAFSPKAINECKVRKVNHFFKVRIFFAAVEIKKIAFFRHLDTCAIFTGQKAAKNLVHSVVKSLF
jgi:hypothetical protein